MRILWLVAGTLVGAVIGTMLSPARAAIGLPVNETLFTIVGALLGALAGALVDSGARPPQSPNE